MAGDKSTWNITKPQTIRIESGMWTELDAAAKTAGYPSRTALLRAFVQWYLRRPGAPMPQRPDET